MIDRPTSLFVIKCVHEMQEVRVMEVITSFMHQGNSRKTFSLFNVNIEPVESTALFEFLSYDKNMHTLHIFGCRMPNSAYRELAKLLIQNNKLRKLTELRILNSPVTDESACYLNNALKSGNCKLTKLMIFNCELTDEGGRYLSDALKSGSCKLTELDIAGNRLTEQGARYLSDALKSDNCKLTKLQIACDSLTDEGARYLSDALKSDNCKLIELDISVNRLTDEGCRYLRDSLKSDKCRLTMESQQS